MDKSLAHSGSPLFYLKVCVYDSVFKDRGSFVLLNLGRGGYVFQNPSSTEILFVLSLLDAFFGGHRDCEAFRPGAAIFAAPRVGGDG